MKKLVLPLLLLVSCLASAQVSYTYLFSTTPFNSTPSGGPLLQTIDSTITPVLVTMPITTCPDTPTISLTHFVTNAGFKAKAFFTGTYSVEMIFKFDELNGYNRIIDFSNSTSDYGIYTYGTCLNFYPSGSIGICPYAYDTINYKQLVITRNNVTKNMNVYLNDSLFTTFSDVTDYYVIGNAPGDSITFFKDDNVVINEASSGNVALIRIADYEFSAGQVDSSYHEFCDRITGIVALQQPAGIMIYPNPGNGNFKIDTPADATIEVFNDTGVKVIGIEINKGITSINLEKQAKGIYFVKVGWNKNHYTQKVVIE